MATIKLSKLTAMERRRLGALLLKQGRAVDETETEFSPGRRLLEMKGARHCWDTAPITVRKVFLSLGGTEPVGVTDADVIGADDGRPVDAGGGIMVGMKPASAEAMQKSMATLRKFFAGVEP